MFYRGKGVSQEESDHVDERKTSNSPRSADIERQLQRSGYWVLFTGKYVTSISSKLLLLVPIGCQSKPSYRFWVVIHNPSMMYDWIIYANDVIALNDTLSIKCEIPINLCWEDDGHRYFSMCRCPGNIFCVVCFHFIVRCVVQSFTQFFAYVNCNKTFGYSQIDGAF